MLGKKKEMKKQEKSKINPLVHGRFRPIFKNDLVKLFFLYKGAFTVKKY